MPQLMGYAVAMKVTGSGKPKNDITNALQLRLNQMRAETGKTEFKLSEVLG